MVNAALRRKKVERLYQKYSRLLLKVARDSTDDPYLAEDAVQQTFEKVIARIDDIDDTDERRTGGLLILMCKQAVAEQHRRKTRVIGVTMDSPPEQVSDDPDPLLEHLLRMESPEVIRDYLSWLPDKYLDPLLMHCIEEKSVSCIAHMLHISEKGVYMRIARAKQKIQSHIEKEGGWLL